MPYQFKSTQPTSVVQFTKEMAEGSQPLPPGIIFASRKLGPDGRFPECANDGLFLFNYDNCHTHYLDEYIEDGPLEWQSRVRIGDWVVKVNGKFTLYTPEQFAQRFEWVDAPTRNAEDAGG